MRLFRKRNEFDTIPLDSTPTPDEEERFFGLAPEDLGEAERLVEIDGKRQDMGERLRFHDRAFFITLIWVIFLTVLPFAQMIFSLWKSGLSDAQFVTVITTTTAAIFGFWLLVGNYLFKK